MKIALIQQHSTRNKENNMQRGVKAVREASEHGANLVAFAELAFDYFIPQHPAQPGYLDLSETIPGPTTDLFCKEAHDHGVIIVLNLYERDGKKAYDCSPVINTDGSIIGKNRMVHIIEAPCFHEKGYYTPGNLGATVFPTALGKIGIAICYDRHYPEYMRELALNGAELVITPQAGAVGEWPDGIFEAEMQIAAFQNGYFTALANRVGKEDCLTFAGGSFISNPEGQVIARAPEGIDYILYADIDLSQIQNCTAKRHFLADRIVQD